MSKKKTKEQLLEELIEMQKSIEQKVEAQEQFINKFQALIQNEGLFSKIIENLPYPVVIYDHSGVLKMVNKALLNAAKIKPIDVTEGKINFLNHISNENYAVLEAVEDVFLGETIILNDLSRILSLFSINDSENTYYDTYHNAVFFPVVESSGQISHGALMLMK